MKVAGMLLAALVLAAPFAVQRLTPDSTAAMADTEQIGINRLGAATVDLALRTESGDPLSTSEEAVFSARGMAPGDRAAGTLSIGNTGDLPIDYEMALGSAGGLLADWLKFEVWLSPSVCNPAQPDVGTLRPLVLGSADGAGPVTEGLVRLMPGNRIELCVGASLPLDAPNELQGRELDMTIVVTARQRAGAGSGGDG